MERAKNDNVVSFTDMDREFDPKSKSAAELTKTMLKLMGRLERIMLPVGSIILTAYTQTLAQRIEHFIKQRLKCGEFYFVSSFTGRLLVNWDLFYASVIELFSEGHPDSDVQGKGFILPKSMQDDLDAERHFQEEEEKKYSSKEQLRVLHSRNGQPIMPGKWHKEAYPKRIYTELTDYTVTPFVSDEEANAINNQLLTTMDGFLGPAYNYDDHGLTEEWMVTFTDSKSEAPSDDEVIRVQCSSLLEILTSQVQDRVCNENGVLHAEPVGLNSGKLKQAQVWGIDCYTRRMIEIAIEDRVGKVIHTKSKELRTSAAGNAFHDVSEGAFTEEEMYIWLERILLPSINAQPVHLAHNMLHVTNDLLEKHHSGESVLKDLHVAFTRAVHSACLLLGIDMFRIHPKGTGIICTAPEGIPPHVFISEYLGEIYPPYRWCERLDVVDQAQHKYSLKPTLPDFYNILLERPRQDAQGYGLLFVDASQKSNMGSSCSHSCRANTSANVVARNGRLTIALTTNRFVYPNEELTMDYSAMTTSDIEWRSAICLCGTHQCRGSFLHYATQDDLQQVLNQNCGPLWRFASLLKSCTPKPLSKSDEEVMDRHGLRATARSDLSKLWMKKYAADNLRFLEFERKALPCSLMRPVNGRTSGYTCAQADLDARSVMEQRLQSLVCCFSMLQRVVAQQPPHLQDITPLSVVSASDATCAIWGYLKCIPALIEEHVHLKVDQVSLGKKRDRSAPFETISQSDVSNGSYLDETRSTIVSTKPELDSEEANQVTSDDLTAKRLRLKQTLAELKAELSHSKQPNSLTGIRALCLNLRNMILKIEDLSTATARLGLLADLLVLWANTSNFSVVNKYAEIVSQPIPVVARDLGMCVPRSKIYNPTSKRIQAKSEWSNVADIGAADVLLRREGTSCDMQLDTTDTDAISVSRPSVSADTAATALPVDNKSALCDPNEIVHVGCKRYGPLFVFDQLSSWFNAGTDEKLSSPDIIGCVQLPVPSMCFGPSDGTYGSKQRELLLEHLGDDKAQIMSWPVSLKACFNYSQQGILSVKEKKHIDSHQGEGLKSSKKDVDNVNESGFYRMKIDSILGSPMLDVALGQVDAVLRVMQDLLGAERAEVWLAEKLAKKHRANRKSRNASDVKDEEDAQFDAILPPEIPTAWVQCEDCRKWRRVPWHVDAEKLPDVWYCRDNTWDLENATCNAEQDVWDPTRESTLETVGAIEEEDSFEIGTWRDVFCVVNQCYYVGQIKQVQEEMREGHKVISKIKFHFKGWSSKFDEWVTIDSGRIAPLNLYTDPMSKRPSEQERWQGKKSSFTPKESKIANKESTKCDSRKRKRSKASNEGDEGETKTKTSSSKGKARQRTRTSIDWNAVVY